MTPSTKICLFALGLVLVAGSVWADDAGKVAAATGVAEVGRGGVFSPAEPGMAVGLGDELRTGDGRMRIVLRDDSVLNLSENTQLTISEQVFEPEQGRFNSLLQLIRGKVRSAVGTYYQKQGAVYEVETPTAVAGVRGTTFVVEYDPDGDVTDVIGIHGRVMVRNRDLQEFVYVNARETTSVAADAAPTQPERLDENFYRDRIEGYEVLGRVGLGGLASGAAVQTGSAVPPPDRAPAIATKLAAALEDQRDVSDVVGQPLPIVASDRGRLGVPF